MGIADSIESVAVYFASEPLLITAGITLLVGMFYYFGWIIAANNWQYQTIREGRHAYIYKGFQFLTSYLLLPAVIIGALLHYWDWAAAWLASWPFWAYIASILILYLLLSWLDTWIYRQHAQFKNPIFAIFGVKIASLGELKWIFYLINFGFLLSNPAGWAVVIVVWLDLFLLTKWARVISLHEQGARAMIKMEGRKQPIEARLIEFVADNTFLKVQEKQDGQVKVVALPVSKIDHIEMVTEKPDLISLLEYVLDRLFSRKDRD